MGNAAAGGLEQEPSEGREARNSALVVPTMSDPTPTLQKKQPPPPKLPMPPEEELEERFNVVLVSGAHTHTAHKKHRDLAQGYVVVVEGVMTTTGHNAGTKSE